MKNGCIYGSTTLEKQKCFHSEHRRGYQTKLLTDHSNGGRLTVEVRFAKITFIFISFNVSLLIFINFESIWIVKT